MSETILGKLIEGEASRDAIHVACAPVIAAHALAPGAHVGLLSDGRAGAGVALIGIVDPFLNQKVMEGERFWLCLYQKTVTGMRHEWQHPSFSAEPAIAATSSKDKSEAWLREFVKTADCPDYEAVIAVAVGNSDQWSDEYLHFNGSDAHGEIPPEFWDHVEIVTGRKITQRATHFSCSC